MHQHLEYEIVSFYRFLSFPNKSLKKMREGLIKKGEEEQVVGLILLSSEGINATLSGKRDNVTKYLEYIKNLTKIDHFFYKRSPSAIPAFKKLRVKIKKEIITFKRPGVTADFGLHDLEPDEWESILHEKEVTILDIRNNYEVEIGQFKRAKNLGLKEFKEFPEKLKSVDLPKEQKTLLYCTGGIRCEKAIVEMQKQGFKELYQLKGGVINYLKSFPNKSFEGECFVFDHRVAIDQTLNPSSRYSLCSHCGQAAGEKVECVHCGKETRVCKICLNKGHQYLKTCTKNCAHHFRKGHKYKKQKKKNA